MKRYAVLLVLIQIISRASLAQNTFFCLDMRFVNEQTNVFIPHLTINIPDIEKEMETDKAGQVHLLLPPGIHYMYCSHKEFKEEVLYVELLSDTSFTVYIEPNLRSYYINDVTITSNKQNKVIEGRPGLEKIESRTINQIPTFGGEKDVVKIIQFLPGVKAGAEGSSEIMVRGGNYDQNLFLYDNAILYNPEHLLGFLSVYNPMSVGSVNFYKGGFPSQYGGRLSSVIDVSSKAVNYDTTFGELNIGTVSSKANLNLPIIKSKSAVFVSGRRTYLDLLVYLFQEKENRSSLNFYDLAGKYTHRLQNGKVVFGYYTDRDKQYSIFAPNNNKDFRDEISICKRNSIASCIIDTKHKLGKNLISVSYVTYKLDIEDYKERPDNVDASQNSFNSSIKDITIKERFVHDLGEKLKLTTGAELTNHLFAPASFIWKDSFGDTSVSRLASSRMFEASIFCDLQYLLPKAHSITIGLRNTGYFIGPYKKKSVEPRLAISYLLSPSISLKLSYTAMSQPMHLLSNPGLGLPVDIWFPADNNFHVETSNQYTLGFFAEGKIGKHRINLSIEGYYKTMQDIISYKDGYSSHNFTSLNSPELKDLTNAISVGDAYSYGVEFLVEKKEGTLNGWIGYTLSWTKNRFDDINNGLYFYPRFDSRHNISIVGSYKISHRWSAGMSWQYYTGQHITLPENGYNFYRPDYTNGHISSVPEEFGLYEQGARNWYRMKDFHSLSIDFKRVVLFKRTTGLWEFGAYNLYNRQNPYYYYFSTGPSGDGSTGTNSYHSEIKSVSVFPILPYISFSLKF